MINSVSLTGRVANSLELKHTQSGIAVLSFRLTVDRKFKNANGERETDFINVVAWRQTAETMAQYLSKGSLIGIEGNIQTRSYEHNQGYTVFVTEVVADNFAFLESKSQSRSNQNQGQSTGQHNNTSKNQGQTNNNQWQTDDDPFASNNDAADVSDDDLPF